MSTPLLKSLDTLLSEVDAAVHTDGPLGKTTAPGLNAVLKSFATELTTQQQLAPAEAPAVLWTADGAHGYDTAAEAIAAAAAGDTLVLSGEHPVINLTKSLTVVAYNATIAGLICGWKDFGEGFRYVWKGGTITGQFFIGRSPGVPNQGEFHDLVLTGGAYLQSHTNNTDNNAAADTYAFYRCHLTHVQVNHYQGYGQKQYLHFEDCTLAPTTPGAVFRTSYLSSEDRLTLHRCRVVATTGNFEFGVPSGVLWADVLASQPLEANAVNMVADGWRPVVGALPFAMPSAPEQLYPAGGGGGLDTATLVHRTGDESIAGVKTFTDSLDVTALSTSRNELLMQQTGDTYGTISWALRNRMGQNGLTLHNHTLDLVDVALQTSGKMAWQRLEGRARFLHNQANVRGEIQFTNDTITQDGRGKILAFAVLGEHYVGFPNGAKVGIGTTDPAELLEVAGNVQAAQFIGDGSRLTNLPGAAPTTYLQISSTSAARVAEVPVPYRYTLASEVLDVNAAALTYQLDRSTRSGTRQYGAAAQTLGQVNAQLAALTDADLAAGVKLYIGTTPTTSTSPSIVGLTVS